MGQQLLARGRGGEHSSRLLLQRGSPELARQASADGLTKRWGSFAAPPAIKPLPLRCAVATGSADAVCAAISQSATGNWVSEGKLLCIRCRVS